MTDWIIPPGVDEAELTKFAGFTYLITNLTTGRAYVGQKVLKEKKHGKVRHDLWRRYFGSCTELKADVAALGPANFRREILTLCKTRPLMNYEETREMFARNVLYARLPDGSRAFYNGHIMNRFRPSKVAAVLEAGA